MLRGLLILAVGLMVSCASNPPSTLETGNLGDLLDSASFGASPEIITAADIHRLSADQQEAFFEYLDEPSRQSIPTHERVVDYLRISTSEFHYRGETYTASEALSRNSGNCLSLAILTTAFADLAGLDIGYQLVDSEPVFEWRGSVIYKGLHVRSILYDPTWQPGVLFIPLRRPGIRIDYFPSNSDRFVSNLTKSQYVAMYYNNLAADAIGSDDYNAAYWLLRKSVDIAPENASAVNMMAVLHRRIGDEETAERIYQYGIAHLPSKVSFLRNYRVLLNKQARFEEADEIGKTLEALDEPNPIDWLQAGQAAYDDGDFQEAISFYRRAVKLAPYLHEAYLGMAKVYYELGDKVRARRELERAVEHADRPTTKSRYQAKLMSLGDSR